MARADAARAVRRPSRGRSILFVSRFRGGCGHYRRGSERDRRSGDVLMPEPRGYSERTEVVFLGRRLQILDLTREISPDIPVYPGHMKVAMWDHLTHAESKL